MARKPRASDAIMGELHQKLAKVLLERIQSGEASAQDFNAAIKFLKDNGIQGEVDDPDSVENQLAKVTLPQFMDDDDE